MTTKNMNGLRTIPIDRQIAELKTRLAIAKTERDAWQAVGRQQNYLAACAMVDALVLRLDRLQDTTRFPAAGYRYERFAQTVDYAQLDRSRAFAEAGAPPSEAELELMRTLGISYGDGVFHWREYRYDRLADAIAYARRGESS